MKRCSIALALLLIVVAAGRALAAELSAAKPEQVGLERAAVEREMTSSAAAFRAPWSWWPARAASPICSPSASVTRTPARR